MRLEVSSRNARATGGYTKEHRQMLANVGAERYKAINGPGSFVRYSLPEWYQKEQREKYPTNKRGDRVDRDGNPLPPYDKEKGKKTEVASRGS